MARLQGQLRQAEKAQTTEIEEYQRETQASIRETEKGYEAQLRVSLRETC